MNIPNIKKMQSEKGFTIVELLIVIVVIGILAAIVIVAYNGIQNRAKTQSAQATAASLQKKIEAYNAAVGNYPATATLTTALNGQTESKITDLGATFKATALASTDTTKTLFVEYCSAGAALGGYRISYFDYVANASIASPIKVNWDGVVACTTWSPAS